MRGLADKDDPLWFRVAYDGNEVTVRCLDANEVSDPPTENQWADANCLAFTSTAFTNLAGGGIGFTCGCLYIDDLTVEGWDADSSGWMTQLVEDFTVDGNGHAEHRPAHDAAGNLVYDGLYKHTYDAWNRLAKVERAWRDENGALQTGSVIATMEYDGLNRRTKKMIANCGDFDCTYHYTWDRNWRLLETRNGDDPPVPIKQHVWGPRYVDEIVQIAVNTDPSADSNCEALYYPMQNANFNVLGLADANGVLVERYEYTPYGQRSVYKKAGTNDALTSAPLDHSQRVEGASGTQPYTLCDLGHQGLRRDKEFGMYDVRTRPWPALIGRWPVRDPAGHVDGMSLYEYVMSTPTCARDPTGEHALSSGQVRARARQLLLAEQAKHSSKAYYRRSGLQGLFRSLHGALDYQVFDVAYQVMAPDAAAEYSPFWDTLGIQRNATSLTVVHELVHALDDRRDWYLEGPEGYILASEQSEALAYGTEALLFAADFLGRMDGSQFVKDCKTARKTWGTAWGQFTRALTWDVRWRTWVIIEHSRTLTEEDIWDINAKMGVRFSCQELSKVYEEVLELRGIRDAPAYSTEILSGAVGGPVRDCKCTLRCDRFNEFTLPKVFR